MIRKYHNHKLQTNSQHHICACAMFISLSDVSNLLQNGHFVYFQAILVAIVVSLATVKVKLMPEIYTWGIFFWGGGGGGANGPLMHVAL